MKKIFSLILVVLLLVAYGAFALGSSSEGGSTDQGHDSASSEATKGNLGDYNVDILSCRVVSDYEGDPVVIVKYKFTNYDDDAAAFYIAISDKVYQNDVGLNHAYFLDDTVDYSTDNQSKEIRTGASLEVEVAYELNDSTSDIEVEVSETFSFTARKVTKTFSLK